MWLISAMISLLTTNLIFVRALGTSTMMAAAKNRSNLAVLAVLMAVISTLACLVSGGLLSLLHLDVMLVHPWSLGLPLLYTAVISLLYVLVLLVLYTAFRKRFGVLKKYVHLSAFNCAVMGTLYLMAEPAFLQEGETLAAVHYDPLGAMWFGLQQGMGFLLAALMLSAVRKRLYDDEVPAAFRGFPAVMVYIGLLSMAIFAIR